MVVDIIHLDDVTATCDRQFGDGGNLARDIMTVRNLCGGAFATALAFGTLLGTQSRAETLNFEGIAPPNGFVSPGLPYTVGVFTLTEYVIDSVGNVFPVIPQSSGVFAPGSPVGAGSSLIINGNGTSVFGWASESELFGHIIVDLTTTTNQPFSLKSFDAATVGGTGLPQSIFVSTIKAAPGFNGALNSTLNLGTTWQTFDFGDRFDSVLDIDFLPTRQFQQEGNHEDPAIDNIVVQLDSAATPLPAALPLFATGIGALGLLGWRRKKKTAGLAA